MTIEEDPAATFRRVLAATTDIIGKGGLVFSPVMLPFWFNPENKDSRLVDIPRWKVGPWASCSWCGGQTRCISIAGQKPAHMVCQRTSARAPRIEPNRHDRRRMGLPRPPYGSASFADVMTSR